MFDTVVKSRSIGLQSEISPKVMESNFEKYLVIKSQRSRVWLGIVKIIEGPLE